MRAKTPKHKPKAADESGRALLAQALDDEPARLVYADWLEEQGHPFADVIRMQLADTSANALIGRHRKTWIEPIAAWVTEPVFERGMIRRIYGKAGAYAQKATQSLLLGPATTFGIRSTMLRGPCKKLGGAETLAWTNELFWWDSNLDDALLRELASSPHLAQLRSLTLEKLRAGNAGLAALAKLTHLRHLSLPAPVHLGAFTSAGILELLDRVAITSLSLNGLNKLDVDQLVASPLVAKLTHLSAATKHVRAIAASRYLTSLRSLRLSTIDPVDDADAEPLLASNSLTSVHLQLWAPSQPRKLSEAMVARLRGKFGEGFTYETSGIPPML